MPVSKRSMISHRGAAMTALFAVAVAILVVAPAGSLASGTRQPTVAVVPASTTNGVTGSATWNGVNVAAANSTSSAFSLSFNAAVTVLFGWSQAPTGAARWEVNDARLQIFYFGFALATRDITTSVGSPNGNLTMGNWSTGPLEYILEGSYELTASLLANGTTVWSQSFWVDVQAAFYILAALPIVLILIAIYELYGVATVGKQVMLKRQKRGGPPPSSPPAVGTVAGSTSPPAPEPPDPAVASGTPPSAPPPAGGTT